MNAKTKTTKSIKTTVNSAIGEAMTEAQVKNRQEAVKLAQETIKVFHLYAQETVNTSTKMSEIIATAKKIGLDKKLKVCFNAETNKFNTKHDTYQALKDSFRESTTVKYAELQRANIPAKFSLDQVLLERAEWSKLPEKTRNILKPFRDSIKNRVDVQFGRFAAMLFGADSEGRFTKPKDAKGKGKGKGKGTKETDTKSEAQRVREIFDWLTKRNKGQYENAIPEKLLKQWEIEVCQYWKLELVTTVE